MGQLVLNEISYQDFKGEQVRYIKAPSDEMNYEDHEAYVRSKHGRFLTLEEAQEFLSSNALYPGKDQWVAVQDRDWVQAGESCHHAGKSHNRDCGGYPGWGDERSSSPWKKYIMYMIVEE